MTDNEWTGVWIAFFAALPPTLTALAAVIVAMKGRRQSIRNTKKIDCLQETTNKISHEQVRLAKQVDESSSKD